MGATIQDLATKAAADVAVKIDAVLFDAISHRIGAGWTLEDMRGRLTNVRRIGQTFETYLLDGSPILELHDLTSEMKDGRMSFSFNYRTFK